MQQDSNKNTALIGIIAIVIIAAAIVGTIALKPSNDQPATSTTTGSSNTSTTTTDTTTNATDTTSNSSGYANGTYTASGSYRSPGGNEEIDVTITITDGVVTESSVTPLAASRESMEYQDDFVSGYKSQVVGKSLADIQLGKVSGSSLTSRGFNEALDQIRNQAKV